VFSQDVGDAGSSGGASASSRADGKAFLARWWADLDTKYMKPFLTHARPTLLETLPVCCIPLARLLTTTEQLTQVRAGQGREGGQGVAPSAK